jgi:hypothetical protein
MSTAVIPFDKSKLATALKEAPRPLSQGLPYITLTKMGTWKIGQDKVAVKPGTKFYVNPAGFTHGIVAWKHIPEGSKEAPAKLAETVLPVSQALPAPGPAPTGSRGWQDELGCTFMDVESGAECQFLTPSYGGRKAVLVLRDAVVARIESGSDDIVPVVVLGHSTYEHKSYGEVVQPEIEVTRWVSFATLEKLAAKKKPAAAPPPPDQKKLAAPKKRSAKR